VRTPTGGHAATVIAWQTLEPLATGRAQDCVGTAEAGESVATIRLRFRLRRRRRTIISAAIPTQRPTTQPDSKVKLGDPSSSSKDSGSG
jgi:hypothetical protein